jgi:signal transduction histidine kinase/ligand-binding sensor domain-containing protein
MMARNRWALVGCAMLLNFTGHSEGGSRWRVFRAADGLADTSVVAVTLSPRGNVWAKHGSGAVSWLDGFQARSIAFSTSGNSPVFESRSAQIWSAYSEGVMEYRRDQWLQYPVNEIRAENESSALRLVRPIRLLPAERDHVLAVLPDRLLEFDCGQNRTVVLRFARETELGRFNDIVEARDGGAWLSGSNGLAKLPGPVRRLTPGTPWQQFTVDPKWQIQNLERPFEDDEGGVAVTADSLSSGGKVVLYFNGQNWAATATAPEKTRFAWRDLDGTLWAVTRNALSTRRSGDWETVAVPGLRAPQYYDVATEPNGVFWLATTEGLVRHSLQTWRTPKELVEIKTPVFAILEDAQGGLWFAGAQELSGQQNGQLRTFKWPDGFSPSPEPRTSLYNSPDGRILISSAGRVWLFDPATGLFSPVVHQAEREVTAILGQFKNGTLCAQTAAKDPPGHFNLEAFDGRNFEPFFEPKSDWGLGNEFSFLRVSEGDSIWLGGDFGLAAWEPKSKTFVPSKDLPQSRPVELIDAGKGRIWYATGNLAFEFNGRTWSVARFGLGRIRAMIMARDGSLWIASDNGLYRYTDGSWVGNSVEEGLPAKDVFAVRQDRRGELWAATSKGVSLYHRSADLDSPVSSFSVAANPKQVYSSEVAAFFFYGRDRWDYTRRDRLLFSHRVDETPWSPYSSEASARLTNAAAGKHRLSVRAMDRNWNEEVEPEVYEFASVVPWFREPRLLAIASCGAIAILLLAWLAVNRHLRLLRSYAEVEKIVTQRTSELERANQELLHSQKMRALGTLAAGIAHDFNSILSIIKGSAQIIETHLDDRDKIRTRVDRIKTMVEQGSGIVKAMLGFSRAGRSEKWCDVNELVAQTTRVLGDQFQHQVTLEFEPAAPLPQIRGVGELIQQMLLNLILNAADAMGGHGQIELRTGLLERAPANPVLPPQAKPPLVYISIGDQGSGIAPDVLPRIFEPFYTTKAFSTRRGTGLGLSMVYEIAKELGYGLMVESAKGKGSNFTILIPVSRESRETET